MTLGLCGNEALNVLRNSTSASLEVQLKTADKSQKAFPVDLRVVHQAGLSVCVWGGGGITDLCPEHGEGFKFTRKLKSGTAKVNLSSEAI